jgi:FkbM family methyltransferase
MNNYKSQYGQDRWVLEEIFNNLPNGYFIDLAAGDGEFISNTYVLEKDFGWNGICIEPNNTSFEKLKQNRNCMCDNNVIMQDDFEIEFIEYEMVTTYEHLLSTVSGTSNSNTPIKSKSKRPTISLNTLLDKYNAPDVIHYISLDIEGSEIYVLQDFLPNNKRKVLTWTIEVNPGEQHENEILKWMNSYNYSLIKKDGLNGRLGHDYLFVLNEIL